MINLISPHSRENEPQVGFCQMPEPANTSDPPDRVPPEHPILYLPQPQSIATRITQIHQELSAMGMYLLHICFQKGTYQITLVPGPKWPPLPGDRRFRSWGPGPRW
jgi:hypothetical protein